MSQLRSCYFCGTVGDSLREYELVPERLVAPGRSRSAVLCSSCREKLRRVLEPLIEVAESADPSAPDTEVSGVGEVTFESSAPTDGEDVTDTDEDVPDGYYKVLRLLQNREFPMERSDLTALVTGAYDVSEPQCERILETAVERGVLVEDGSTLDIDRE
jgi:hypothetical protein